MSDIVTPVKCEHQHLNTSARCDCIRRDNRIIGYRLSIEAKCQDCGEPFHFPNYLPNESEQVMAAASVSKRATKLITPIAPGRFAPDLN